MDVNGNTVYKLEFWYSCFPVDKKINMFKLVVLLCLAASLNAVTFDYDFVRNKMFPLAAAAYSDSPHECTLNTFDESITDFKWHSEECDNPGNRCFAFAGVLEKQNAIVISFRGTDSASQLWQELVNKGYMNAWSFGKGIVSSYFSFAFMALWNGHLDEHFTTMHQKHPDFEIWVTGHSLGGAMASLAAHYIKNAYQIPGNKIKLVTFGQPRTGDEEYSKQFNADIDYALRIVNDRDLVPHIPFDDFYYHHKYEVWFPDGMEPTSKYAICSNKAESDEKCSNSLKLPISGWIDHRHYFGKLVSDWGKKGCPADA